MYATATLLPYASFEELDLSGLQLATLEGWRTLLEACAKCAGLEVLNMSRCSLGSFGAAEQELLARMLGGCSASVLSLSHNLLVGGGGGACMPPPG